MGISTDAVGKTYPPTEYVVGSEKIREFASATFDTNPISNDEQAAKDAGFNALVAPPMFAVVFSSRAIAGPLFDPEVGINFAMMVHGGQDFEFKKPVVAGDRVTTTASVKSVEQKADKGFYVIHTDSVNQDGETVVSGDWTMIVRGLN